jgi:hypothetical protein
LISSSIERSLGGRVLNTSRNGTRPKKAQRGLQEFATNLSRE